MRSDEEFIEEVSRRANVLVERRRKRRNMVSIAAAAAVCLGCISSLAYILSTVTVEGRPAFDTGMGQAVLLADSSIGAYVLIGVLSFILGVIFTLHCVKWAAKNRK